RAGRLGLGPAHALAGLVELVADRQRRHDQEAIVADLAKAAAQLLDTAVELVGQALEMALLSILASHTILAAIDGDGHVRHDALSHRPLKPPLLPPVFTSSSHSLTST